MRAVVSGRPFVGHRRPQSAVVRASASAYGQGSMPIAPAQYTRVRLKTRSDCELGVSVYPNFRYNGIGGGGWGTVTDLGNGKLFLKFDAEVLVVPDLSFRTTSVLGLPIPPPLNIAINPRKLEGTLDMNTGEVNLEFDSEFIFTIGPIYKAPPMLVRTVLTTEESIGARRQGKGSRLVNGAGRLAGVAEVDKVGDLLVDNFLLLPHDALALLSAEFELQ